MRRGLLGVFLASMLMTGLGLPEARADGFWTSEDGGDTAKCTDKQVVHKAKKKNEADVTEYCLEGNGIAFMAYASGPRQHKTLVFYIPADTKQDNGSVDPIYPNWSYQYPSWSHLDLPGQPRVVTLIRPGERVKNPSGDMEASSGDNLGGFDNQRMPSIHAMAAAMKQEVKKTGAEEVMIISHSGGGIFAAVIAEQYPDLAQRMGIVLVSCPCDRGAWRHHNARVFNNRSILGLTKGEDPVNHLNIPHHVSVLALTPHNDNNTLPRFAETYIEALRGKGHPDATFIKLDKGQGHKYKYQHVTPRVKAFMKRLSGQG